MKLTSRNELSKYKILPFNLYNEAGDLVLKAGDALTVGKLLQLKAYEKIFRDSSPAEEEETIPQDAPEEGGSEPELKTAVKKWMIKILVTIQLIFQSTKPLLINIPR